MRADLCETRRYLRSIASSPKFNMIINKAKLTPTQRKVLIMFTKELYEKMVAMQPHVKMWTELLRDVKMELKTISRLKK